MKRFVIATLLGITFAASPKIANAEIVQLWASGLIGSSFGNGETDRDFFNWAGGGAGGVEVGARLLFVSAYIDYLRFFGGHTGANLVGFNLGGDGSIGLSKSFALVFRLAGTFYLGTLDSADERNSVSTEQIQTRGVGARGGVGVRYTFAKVFSLGVTPQVGYHYFFGGADDDITNTDQNSQGWDVQLMGYARVTLGL